MKVFALIQARMNSSRLPGKALLPILNKPMVQWQIERLQNSKKISTIALLTSNTSSDDPLISFCDKLKIQNYRGSENDVLARFYNAFLAFSLQNERMNCLIIRLTGDCPLIDPFLIDEAIDLFISKLSHGCRYFGYDTNLPDGMDFEIFTWGALKEAHENSSDPFEREHVTPFMWRQPERFKVERFKKTNITPQLRFSVDYHEDLELVEEILKYQEKSGLFLGVQEISDLFEKNPKLKELNEKIIKNEGLIQSALATQKTPAFGIALPKGALP